MPSTERCKPSGDSQADIDYANAVKVSYASPVARFGFKNMTACKAMLAVQTVAHGLHMASFESGKPPGRCMLPRTKE